MSIAAAKSSSSAQGYAYDARNDHVLVYVNGELHPRDQASVSVFDAGFVLGDGVWEGLRLVNGKLLALKDHMARLYEGARAIELDIGLTPDEMAGAIRLTLDKNGMSDGAHIRVMVTRGRKSTPWKYFFYASCSAFAASCVTVPSAWRPG